MESHEAVPETNLAVEVLLKSGDRSQIGVSQKKRRAATPVTEGKVEL